MIVRFRKVVEINEGHGGRGVLFTDVEWWHNLPIPQAGDVVSGVGKQAFVVKARALHAGTTGPFIECTTYAETKAGEPLHKALERLAVDGWEVESVDGWPL